MLFYQSMHYEQNSTETREIIEGRSENTDRKTAIGSSKADGDCTQKQVAEKERRKLRKRDYFKKYAEDNRDFIRAYKKKWAVDNADKVKASDLAKRIADPGKYRAYKKKWRDSNKEKSSTDSKKWYAANIDRAKATAKLWRDSNPVIRRIAKHRRRAREKNAIIGNATAIHTWEKSWRKKTMAICFWCRIKTPIKKCHTDHIVSLAIGGSHSVSNLCISCSKCNLSKNAKTLNQWNKQIKEPVLL